MPIRTRPRFVRHFTSGFALGALCIVATQVAHADVTPAAVETAR